MAEVSKKIMNFLNKWEGGLSRDPKDSASSYPNPLKYDGVYGWHTNKGITYKTWESYKGKNAKKAFFEMSEEDVLEIFKKGYWDKVQGDKIKSQAVANALVSWAWGSGAYGAIKQIQRLLGCTADGIIGKNTLKAINSEDEKELFDKMIKARESFFRYITNERNARNQAQRTRFRNNTRFLRGWLNRLNDFNDKFRP